VTSFLDLPDGFHEGFPEAEYHRPILGVANKGALELVRHAPAKYMGWIKGLLPPRDSAAMDFGADFHAFTLEPSVFAAKYIAEPEFGSCRKDDNTGTTKEQGAENKKRRDAWRAEHVGAELVSAKDLADYEGMRAAILAHPDMGPIFKALWDGNAAAELTMKWQCPTSGLICKARDDLLYEDEVIDVKTCADARHEAIAKARAKYKWHWQEAHYSDGHIALGRPLRRWRFLAIEKTYPYLLKVHECTPAVVDLGRREVEAAKADLMRCLELESWGGLTTETNMLDLMPGENR
jgi:hypothetical protein